MPRVIEAPARIEAAGNKPKTIDAFIGRVRSGDSDVSATWMHGAQYIAARLSAFSPDAVNHDAPPDAR